MEHQSDAARPSEKVAKEETSGASVSPAKPKRPLSAYNIFFKRERSRMLADAPVRPEGKPRRSHGKIGFADLARRIASKWNSIGDEEKESYEKLAAEDKGRYLVDMEQWRKTEKEFGRFGKSTSSKKAKVVPSLSTDELPAAHSIYSLLMPSNGHGTMKGQSQKSSTSEILFMSGPQAPASNSHQFPDTRLTNVAISSNPSNSQTQPSAQPTVNRQLNAELSSALQIADISNTAQFQSQNIAAFDAFSRASTREDDKSSSAAPQISELASALDDESVDFFVKTFLK